MNNWILIGLAVVDVFLVLYLWYLRERYTSLELKLVKRSEELQAKVIEHQTDVWRSINNNSIKQLERESRLRTDILALFDLAGRLGWERIEVKASWRWVQK